MRGTDVIFMLSPISNSATRLITGGLMLTVAVSASWMIEPANTTASALPSPSQEEKTLLVLQDGEYSIRVVSGLPEAGFELLDEQGALVGRFDSLEAVAQSRGMSSDVLLADLTPEEPIH